MGSFATWQRELAWNASQQRHQRAAASHPPPESRRLLPVSAPPRAPGADKGKWKSLLWKAQKALQQELLSPWAAVEQGNTPCFPWAPGQQQSSSQAVTALIPTKSPWEKTLWWAQEPREIKFCLAPKSDLFSQTLSQQSAHSMYFTKRFLSRYDRNEKKEEIIKHREGFEQPPNSCASSNEKEKSLCTSPANWGHHIKAVCQFSYGRLNALCNEMCNVHARHENWCWLVQLCPAPLLCVCFLSTAIWDLLCGSGWKVFFHSASHFVSSTSLRIFSILLF